eukprot:4395398-Pleurochrysis_carterae.AAC.3
MLPCSLRRQKLQLSGRGASLFSMLRARVSRLCRFISCTDVASSSAEVHAAYNSALTLRVYARIYVASALAVPFALPPCACADDACRPCTRARSLARSRRVRRAGVRQWRRHAK